METFAACFIFVVLIFVLVVVYNVEYVHKMKYKSLLVNSQNLPLE